MRRVFELRWRSALRKVFRAVHGRPPLFVSAPRLSRSERVTTAKRMKSLGPWFHNMNIARGIWTHPGSEGAGPDYPAVRWSVIRPMLPDITDKHCLDIGCSSGFFSLKLKELGAASVTGIDEGEQHQAIEQARFASSSLKLDVNFQRMSVYDVPQLERQFDLVLFLGVFYHLHHPLLALQAIRKACKGTLLMQTITTNGQRGSYEIPPEPLHVNSGLWSDALSSPEFPMLRFVEGALDGDASCWFIPSVEGVLAMLRATGFKPDQLICPLGHEVIVRCSVGG